MISSRFIALAASAMLAASCTFATPQEATAATAIDQSGHQPLPTLVPSEGTLAQYSSQKVSLRFAIYSTEEGREPLWSEEQTVELGAKGEYSVLLGAQSANGLPPQLFAAGEPRWLAVSVNDAEEARTLLASVPYAMKAADAESLAGHAASDFVTHEQLSQFSQLAQSSARSAQQGSAALPPQQNSSGTVSGSGTAGSVPMWTGTQTQGNSEIVQVGTDIGINEATPGATLDVGGTAMFRGTATLPAEATATTSAGYRSQLLDFTDSAWSTTTKAPIAQTWRIYATEAGNNTASPTSSLNFQFQNGAGTATPTVLSIAQTGVISFAPAQTFPGTIKSVAAASPVTATTTAGAVSLGLNTSALETSLNSVYPQLGSYNKFTSGASFGGETTLSGNSTDWMLVATNAGAGKGTILGQAVGTSTGIEGASPGGIGVEGATDTGYGVYGIANTSGTAVYGGAFGSGPAGSFWSQNASGPAVNVSNVAGGDGLHSSSTTGLGISGSTTSGSGVYGYATTGSAITAVASTGFAGNFSNNTTYNATISATNNGAGNAGIFNNNSASHVALAGVNDSTDSAAIGTYGSVSNGDAVYGVSTAGSGIYGTSTSGFGVYGTTAGGTGISGVAGIATGAANGVYGYSSTGIGVFAATSESGAEALLADGGTNSPGVYAQSVNSSAVIGHSTNANGGFFVTENSNTTALGTFNEGNGDSGALFSVFSAGSPKGSCGVGGSGSLSCTGQLKSLVDASGGTRKVETYAVQSHENWMEDFGSGELQKGVAVVKIDPVFAETVSETADYHVFITPNGDSQGLYVIRKTADSFEVRESGGGTSSLSFDFRIVAKRRGYEGQRHVDVTERFKAEKAILPPHRRADMAAHAAHAEVEANPVEPHSVPVDTGTRHGVGPEPANRP